MAVPAAREVSSEGQTWKRAKPKACSIFLLNDLLQAILELLSNSFVKSSWCDFYATLRHGACREAPLCGMGDIFFTSDSVGEKNKVILGTEQQQQVLSLARNSTQHLSPDLLP